MRMNRKGRRRLASKPLWSERGVIRPFRLPPIARRSAASGFTRSSTTATAWPDRRPRARPKKVGRIFGPRRWIRKKLAAFSALGGRFLRFPIDDRSATERTRALTVPAGKARPSLINARPARALDQKNLATLSVPAGVFFGLDSTGKVIPR